MKTWSGNHRSRNHDYKSKSIYHITMVKATNVGYFGQLAGDFHLPAGSQGSSYIKASPIGQAIKEALRLVPQIHPALKLYQYALMPDHLHLVISVEEPLDEELGRKLARFKLKAAEFAAVDRIFQPGFNDQILYKDRSLDAVFRYLRENPYRLAIRRAHPEYFNRKTSLTIGRHSYHAYGNISLLSNPFKEQVVVHRQETEAEKASKIERWMHMVANGGVLVSPFISKAEKEIRAKAEEIDGKIILITHESFPELFKPAKHDFNLCCKGRLLIISLGKPTPATLSRADCMAMNELATAIISNY